MSESTTDKIAALRAKADQLVKQAAQDPTLRDRLRAEPITTLQEAGFPAGDAAQLARELAAPADVSGHYLCDGITCIITWCADWGRTNVVNSNGERGNCCYSG